MYHSFLILSSADGYLGCFHVLAIINSGALFQVDSGADKDHLGMISLA